ncbi:MAG: energy-coupling factor transporter transmembrane component T [Dehalococcoidia bacterium]|nr:energy-coupling factor transporter transmembrane component T [Dehalococcoidia bacterium]
MIGIRDRSWRGQPVRERTEREGARGRVGRADVWLVWLLAASVAVFLTSNPLYLATACLGALMVCTSLPWRSQQSFYDLAVKLVLFFALLSIPFNLLTGGRGPTLLFELPSLTFPDWFGGVTLGGAVTLESLLYALERALRVVALLLFAAAFNLAVDHYRLLRLLPPGLRQLGIVLTVAVMLLPQLVRQSKSAVEAQRLRGRKATGLRSVAALAVPVLGASLERSVQRAESLDARGFGRVPVSSSARRLAKAAASVAGAALLGAGSFVYFYYSAPAVAALLLLGGTALVAVAFWGGGDESSFYVKEMWDGADFAIAGSALLAPLMLLALRVLDAAGVGYSPFPEASFPAFHPLAVAAFLLLPAPALLMLSTKDEESDRG